MLKIKRRIIFNALEEYRAEKSTSSRRDGVISYWQDPELGDPAFYRECVEPLVKQLDGYGLLVKLDMGDADVEKVFSEAVPGWREIRYKIAELRRRYMEDKLTE